MKILLLIITLYTGFRVFGQSENNAARDSIELIKRESLSGQLDFNKLLEKENQALYLFEGVAYNRKDFAILLWGKRVKKMGLASSKIAMALWEEIYERKMSKTERKALLNGYNHED